MVGVRLIDPHTNQEYIFEPARDIAYFWPQLVGRAAKDFEDNKLGEHLYWYMMHHNLSMDEAQQAVNKFGKACVDAGNPDSKTPFDSLQKSGFLDLSLPAQMAVCAKMGQIAFCAFWTGIRSATRIDDTPPNINALANVIAASEQKITQVQNDKK